MHLKQILPALLSLLSAAQAFSQVSAGSQGLFLAAGTPASVEELVLIPSSDYTLANTVLHKTTAPVNGQPTQSVNRYFTFSPALSGFAGTVGFFIADGDLNGNSRTDLQIAYKTSPAVPYTFATPSGTTGTFTSYDFGTSGNFYQITAAVVSTALPVSLASFSVKPDRYKARIEWVTLSEKNNDFFRIERSVNARDFQKLADVKGKNFSDSRLTYVAYDDSPEDGVTYYKLTQFDLDGTSKDYGVKAVVISKEERTILAYPNPGKGEVFLRLPGKNMSSLSVRMIGPAGGEVYREKLWPGITDPKLHFPAGLPAGLYLLDIQGDGLSRQIRFSLLP